MNTYKVKSLCLMLGIILFGIEMRADSDIHSHNIYVDLFGSSNIISVNYDTRFGGSSVFGWRAGVGCSVSAFDHHFFPNYQPGISLPLGVNALFGKHASKFEIGVGITPSLAAYRKSVEEHDDEGNHITRYIGPTLWRGSYALGIDLGYRLQRANGFMFRIGLSPCLDMNKWCVSIHMLSFLPYISFGYTFR